MSVEYAMMAPQEATRQDKRVNSALNFTLLIVALIISVVAVSLAGVATSEIESANGRIDTLFHQAAVATSSTTRTVGINSVITGHPACADDFEACFNLIDATTKFVTNNLTMDNLTDLATPKVKTALLDADGNILGKSEGAADISLPESTDDCFLLRHSICYMHKEGKLATFTVVDFVNDNSVQMRRRNFASGFKQGAETGAAGASFGGEVGGPVGAAIGGGIGFAVGYYDGY
ncbi:uncharacterized protein MONBRDRAFT_12240 [Monosiga brevicollis MX1]|uniref:Uncharacterized protein n=1 Tax=Monosiga brevicollis TaxID=81824 RepID=A9VBM9_MONBE|nr:uncharacterized protein MONBRDRAFT_12240 [Monosiga brevicollis MX1]EDQ85091.1 predicted protein [Monosiga brevicollis MX1]|eukprot:XP_001750095.1 hypothetical protein [Monosiga brevicollis MX1]